MSPSAPARTRHTENLSHVPYLPGLDGMRALAVMAVLVYHANSEWLSGGFLGVEIFFVISGYLITLLLMDEWERHGRIDMLAFWGRRARRLLPALFVLLFLLLTYTWIFEWSALGRLRAALREILAARRDVDRRVRVYRKAPAWRFSLKPPTETLRLRFERQLTHECAILRERLAHIKTTIES